MSRPFDHYAAHLDTVAAAWPAIHPATAAPRHEHVRYNMVAEAASDELKASWPDTPDQLTSGSARFGQKIILRYCLLAAHLARQQDFSIDQLAELLYEPRSFETLGIIASHPLPVVTPVENHFGLKHYAWPVQQYQLDQMNIGSGFVDLVGVERVIAGADNDPTRDSNAPEAKMCAAHRNRILERIYHSLVTICLRDENLFTRTLSTKD